MLQNFIRIAIRNLLRQKGYTLINIIGLSVGIASALLIFMFVFNENNYDRFNQQAKQIYRVYQDAFFSGEHMQSSWTPAPLASTLKSDFPEVLKTVRMDDNSDMLVTADSKYYILPHVVFVDSSFFSVFSYTLLQGDPHRALLDPYSVVLTKSTARKIFGDADAMNRTFKLENDSVLYRVTGISQDPPGNSHFDFDMLISFSSRTDSKSDFWLNNFLYTYVILPDNVKPAELEKKFPEMIKKYIGPQLQKVVGLTLDEFMKKGNVLGYRLQPLLDIHLNTSIRHGLKPSSNQKYLYIFSIIGLFIILIACINFMNLATARSTNRAREVGMRKVLGSDRKTLVAQFLAESILLSILSLGLAIVILELTLPYINSKISLHLGMDMIHGWQLAFLLLGISMLIGIIAGFYPAFLLSSFKPAAIFRDKIKSGSKGSLLRNILVTVQFIITIAILVCTLVVYEQLSFMQHKDLGFDKERLLTIERAGVLKGQIQTFIAEVKKFPEVANATNSTCIPGFPNSDNSFMIEGRNLSDAFNLYTNYADCSFQPTYRFLMASGRYFSPDMPSDSTAAVINEAAVRKMGLKNPLETRLLQPSESGKYRYIQVIGVLKDFHFQSLHSKIEPYIILYKTRSFDWGGIITIRIGSGNLNNTVQKIEKTWKQFTNNQPFGYKFLDDELNNLYKEEKRTSYLSLTFTILAILIACLGLLGLISYSTLQRTKEIAVRKIMGASALQVVSMLSRETLRLILLSTLLAWPLAYLFLHQWLNDFVFRVKITPLVFILSTSIVLLLSFATIGYQSIYAATRNPSDSLRHE